MDGGPIRVGHFVELVDAADSLVSQDQGPSFEHHLAGQRILGHRCGQTHTGRTAPSRVLTWTKRIHDKQVFVERQCYGFAASRRKENLTNS